MNNYQMGKKCAPALSQSLFPQAEEANKKPERERERE
jgi:hypothetical protein